MTHYTEQKTVNLTRQTNHTHSLAVCWHSCVMQVEVQHVGNQCQKRLQAELRSQLSRIIKLKIECAKLYQNNKLLVREIHARRSQVTLTMTAAAASNGTEQRDALL